MGKFTLDTRLEDVVDNPAFSGFGRLVFPVDDSYYTGGTLDEFRLKWYTFMNPEKTVDILNRLNDDAEDGNRVFYPIYSDEEMKEDPEKADTGIFFLRGKKDNPFAICVAGGNYEYVGALHDSFPHALELSERGYNAFVLIYRRGENPAREDMARAISFVFEHADELGVSTDGYSLWGGSAGAKISGWLASHDTSTFGEKKYPYPCCAILQYTSMPFEYDNAPPTYINMGTNDQISNIHSMKKRMEEVSQRGTDTMMEIFEDLPHGYGLGFSTIADGWIENALSFWEKHRND